MATLTTVTIDAEEIDPPIYDIEGNYILTYTVTDEGTQTRSHERSDLETLELRVAYLSEYPETFSGFSMRQVKTVQDQTELLPEGFIVAEELHNGMTYIGS